ncbi:theronine dehydrogenase [Cereibacter sphaeroides]|uniref:theronine dehydrogenase n=1 Tax=Cereibacter sphaeroides TaxID=1063 RepID=UPI001365CD40|nr:theronine dehydrogenase [Cereibacter sphaeroides]
MRDGLVSFSQMTQQKLRCGVGSFHQRKMRPLEPGKLGLPEEIERIWKPGTGYVVCVEPLAASREPVRWSTEAKARVRRRNLMRRLQHRVPLFAHQFYEAELSNRRNYFSGL